MPRKDVEFSTLDGVTLRGWLYTPVDAKSPLACLIMMHGWTCLKEMELPQLAERFIAALPLAVLIYDHRGFGASDAKEGVPRREVDPNEQIYDLSDAISYAQSLPDTVDPERIGIWGDSYAGGHVLVVGATDPRAKAVITRRLAGGTYSIASSGPLSSTPHINPLRSSSASRRRKTRQTASCEPDPMAAVAYPTAAGYKFLTKREKLCDWKNDLTLRSSWLMLHQNVIGHIEHISPRPLLMLVMDADAEACADLALAAYEEAREPKRLKLLRGGHFDSFWGPGLEQSMAAQIGFLKDTLCLES